MSRRPPSPLDFAADLMRLAIESQEVMTLRMLKFAGGGEGLAGEFNRMVDEKVSAAFDAQREAGRSALVGQAHLAPARTLALYRRRVRANQRRLSRGG